MNRQPTSLNYLFSKSQENRFPLTATVCIPKRNLDDRLSDLSQNLQSCLSSASCHRSLSYVGRFGRTKDRGISQLTGAVGEKSVMKDK
jgi:hypothetical protein